MSESTVVNRFYQTAATFLTITLLAACGGGSTGQITVSDINFFYSEDSTGIIKFATEEGDFLPTADLIAIGSASYTGFATIVPTDTYSNIVGRTEIDANFGNGGSLTGRVDDLVQIVEGELPPVIDPETGESRLNPEIRLIPLSGALTLSNGNIQELSPTAEIDIDVIGSITIPASMSGTETEENYQIDGVLFATADMDGNLYAFGGFTGHSQDATLEFEAAIGALRQN